jgi:hypothetical protein
MGILAINTQFPGQVGVKVRRIPIIATDNLATVTTTGYLNPATLIGNVLEPTDIICMWYGYVSNRNPGTYDEFTLSFNSIGQITLVPAQNTGDVSFIGDPIVGALAQINDLVGNITNNETINPLRVLQSGFDAPDTNANMLIVYTNSIAVASLNAGAVVIFTPAADTIYRVLQVRSGGSGNSNFSGGGGDRNITVQMGSTAYGTIPAATAQALANVPILLGGGTTFAYAASASASQNITTANPLQLAYSGGTTNYSAGSISLEFLLQRVS